MRGKIFLLFFSIFVLISILVPAPMFPGSWFCLLIGNLVIGSSIQDYITIFSALFNGLFYGIIMWLVFIIMARKIN